MQDQVARVKSSLLLFPEVTLEALGEDEITLDSVLRGKFAAGKNGLAWLACGPHLEVVNAVTGERLSAYRFSGVTEHPPTVLAVKEFSWQKRTGLLVGIEEVEGSVLCLYDLGISRVVKAVVLPGRVTAIEPIINHGGASASTQHLHQSLRWFFGVAAVVTDVGHILLVDLCLDDLSCSHDELEASDLEVMSGISPEIPHIRESVTRQRRQLCLQLINPSGTPVTSLSYIARTNQLAVGFSAGYLSLWNMKTLKREYHCLLEGGRVPVYAVAFQEPENDPRNCCYLWAVQSTQESEGDLVSLHLLQLAFGDRKCLPSGQILYEGLEYCEERYSLDLTGGVFSLRNQTSNTRLLGCQTVERFRSHGERDDSLSEAVSPDTSVSVFSWQVNIYGQGKPSTYLAVFDINRWYHAQMPDSLRHGEFLHNCPYFTLWSLDAVVTMTSPHYVLDVLVHERSLSRGVPPSYPPPEQFFNPSTYNFDATCLMNSGVVHVACTGLQKGTLHFLKKSGPFVSEAIPDVYNRCLVAGLLSPRLADVQPSVLSQEEQMQAVLSTAVGTCSLGLLTGSIKQWTAEEQPSSGANLRFILEWTWSKVITTKEELDRLCASLFDGSCNFIDPQTLQSLQHCHLLLGNLSSVLNCFLTEAQELTKKGFIDLTNKKVVVSLLFQYTQVVLWFCRSGLLPEGSDLAADMQLSRPSYNYPSLHNYYVGRRQKMERLSRGKWNFDCLMIDGMVSQFGDRIENLWSRDDGGTGKYPPATLHALLDIYLLENVEESMKHAITIYLLLDIIFSIPNKTETAIESFPTAFAIPLGLVKLIEGFWLLDHNDHKNSLDGILHPATNRSMLTWYHARIINALMCQGEHQQALRYIQMMKPPLTSSNEVILHLTVLLCNRSIVEAMNLLRLHSSKLNVNDLLRHMYETCQEMGLMEDLLKLPFTELEQECLENFLQNSGGVKNQEFLLVHHLQRANYISALQLNQSLKVNMMNDREPRFRERTDARNSILDQYGKVLPRVQMRLAAERTKPYTLPSSVLREVTRPTPLSTVVKQISTGNIVSKATFINHVLSKIREVSTNEQKDDYSPYKSSFTNEDSLIIPDAFVGTPRTKTSQRTSRLLNSVVRPVPQSSPELASYQLTPGRMNSSLRTASSPSPRQSNLRKPGQMKNILKASEFSLLETPLVVRRAKALATCGVNSGFSGYTPQSILRSSLRTTPLVSPCVSPGRSITPPLRSKETKISFMEEKDNGQWTNETTGDCKTKLLLFDSPVMKSLAESRANWANRTEKMSSIQSGHSGCADLEIIESSSRVPEKSPSKINASKEIRNISAKSKKKSYSRSGSRMCLDLEIDESSMSEPENSPSKMDGTRELSNVSAKSDQTTVEFLDAQSSEDFDDDLVFVTCNPPDSVFEKPTEFHNWKQPDQIVENGQLEFQQTENGHFNVCQLEHVQCYEDGLDSTAEPLIEFPKQPGEHAEFIIHEQLELEELKSSFRKDDKASPAHYYPSIDEDLKSTAKAHIEFQKNQGEQKAISGHGHLKFEHQNDLCSTEYREFEVAQLPQYHVDDLVNTITVESSETLSEQENEVLLENEPEDFQHQTCFPVEDNNNLKETEVEYLVIPENEVHLLDDMNTVYDTVPENGVVILDHLNTVQDIDIATSLLPVDSETLENEFGEKALSVKSSTCTSESTIVDAESVISVHDSDDIASTNSENRSEESNHESQSKDSITVAVLEKNEITKEAAPMANIYLDYADSSRSQIKVLENNDELEMHLEETGAVEYRVIDSLGTSRILSIFEKSDTHFVLEMDDGKESTECEVAEMGGEIFVGGNNFSLVLEECESDPGISTLEIPENTASVIKKVEEQKKSYTFQNTLSFVTTVHEPTIAEALKLVSENSTVEALPNVFEIDGVEAQSHGSEPIKEALTDKVLVVCTDQASINIHSEVVSQSVSNIAPCKPSETNLKSAAEANGSISFTHVNESLTSELRLRTQNIKDLSILSKTTQNLSPKEQEPKARSTPKRSSRRTKDLLESEEILMDKQISQTFTLRKRISRKDQLLSTPHPGESIQPTKEVEPETYIVRRGFKKSKGSISDSADVLSTENLPLKGIPILDTPKRISRVTRSFTEEQTDNQLMDHQELKKPTTPSRSNQSKIAFEISESITSERVTSEPSEDQGDVDQHLTTVSKKGAKGGRGSSHDHLKHPVLDSSKLTDHKELPSTPRRSARRAVLSVSEVSAMPPKPQTSEKTVKGQENILKAQRLQKRIDTSRTDNQNVKGMSPESLDERHEEIINIHNHDTRTITTDESQLYSIAEEDTQLKTSQHVAHEERMERTVLVLSDLPSSAEKLNTARKSNLFKDDAELAANERLQEAAKVVQTDGVSVDVVQVLKDLGGNILQPSLAVQEHSGLYLIMHSTSDDPKSNNLVGQNLPIGLDDNTYTSQEKDVDKSGHVSGSEMLANVWTKSVSLTPKRGARGRNKSVVELSKSAEPNVTVSQLPPVELVPFTPRRSSRRGASNLSEVTENNPLGGSGLAELEKILSASSKRGKRGKSSQISNKEDGNKSTSEVTSEDSSSELVSRRNRRGQKKEYMDNDEAKGHLPSVSEESILEKSWSSPERGERLYSEDHDLTTFPKLHPKVNPPVDEDSVKAIEEEEHKGSIKEVIVPKHRSKMTKINDKQKKHSGLVAEESTDKNYSDVPESKERLQGTDSVLPVTPVQHRKEDTVVEHSNTRTRSSILSTSPYISVDSTEQFVFSRPSTKRKNQKAIERKPVLPFNIESDITPQFVYSPPALRTRRKDQSSISDTVKEKDVPIKKSTVDVEEPIVKKRGRPPKSKAKDSSTSANVPWSPPPVEVNLISPMTTPATEAKSKVSLSSDEPTEKMTLRRNRKRLISTFTKPVTRRKMR